MVAAITRANEDGGGGGSGGSSPGSFGGNAGSSIIDGNCTYNLQDIIMELCTRAGADPRTIDAAQLASIRCRGFTVINQYPCVGAIQSLAQIFLFDPSNYDGVVHFVVRGADAVATITEEDFVIDSIHDSSDDPEDQTSSRSDSISIPQTLNLNYYDAEGGLATSLQSSQRIGDPRATGSQDLQTAVILSANEAARVVKINHQVMAASQKSQLNISLTDKFLALTSADNVFVDYGGKVRRYRITMTALADGSQSYQMLSDRQTAYISKAQGIPPSGQSAPPEAIVGATLIAPIDIHIISDRDDYLGLYLAFGARTDAWAGAVVDVSIDGGASYFTSFQVSASTVMGELSSPLGSHPQEYPDSVNRCTVDLANIKDELFSASLTQMQNGVNLAIIGDEVVQFGNANETTTQGTWELDYWLRGRDGAVPIAHSAGERFVMLDRDPLYFLPAELSYLGRSLTLRSTSYNGTADDVVIVTFIYTGQSQTERPVAYLSGRRAAGHGLFSWQGVGKLGSGASVAMGVHFVQYTVTLTDGTVTQTVQTIDQSLDVDLSAFAGAVTCSVSAQNNLTGSGPAVTVIV